MVKLLEQNKVLRNGLSIWFRPIRADDTSYLLDIFNHLGSDSRYSRFHQSLESVTQAYAHSVASQMALDSVTHGFGLLAFTDLETQDNVPIGGARYFIDTANPESAEFAITIRDEFQQLGLGKRLLNSLMDQARQRDIKFFTGIALADNRGIWNLLTSTNLPLDRWYDGSDMYFRLSL